MVRPEADTESGHGGELSEDPAVSGTPEERERGRLHLETWLTAREGSALARLADEVFSAIPAPAITPGRSHRRDAMQRRALTVRCLLANLTVLLLDPLQRKDLLVSLKAHKRSRYNVSPISADLLGDAIRALQALAIVTVEAGVRRRSLTRLQLTAHFASHMRMAGVSLRDVVKLPGEEAIILRARRNREERERVGKLMDYTDDGVTVAMRGDMTRITDAINAADLRIDGQPVPPVHLVRIFQHAEDKPAWSQHGRLYRGAVWLDMEREQRHRLTLGGRPLADLDFAAMFTRIAYAETGQPFPDDEDPYDISGLEGYRDAVKALLTSLFFRQDNEPARRLPRDVKLPQGWTMARFVKAASEKHPAIASRFNTEDGFGFFAKESSLMVAILLELLQNRVVALPCHDGLLVAQDDKAKAVEVMERLSRERLGGNFPVVEKLIVAGL